MEAETWRTENTPDGIRVWRNGRLVAQGDPHKLLLEAYKRIQALEERIHSITEVR